MQLKYVITSRDTFCRQLVRQTNKKKERTQLSNLRPSSNPTNSPFALALQMKYMFADRLG